ncbi:MAG: relaxase domain-containing protein, partial [Proteobacteria bacterium]|nr:relaxase domain-containing protein [Pseudomonadota bacterium]
MLTYKVGVAGLGGGKAYSRYLSAETLKPENAALAQYYAGETIPEHELTGMDHLAYAVLEGEMAYSEVMNDLMRAHLRTFGVPGDIDGLDERISAQLLRSLDNVEARLEVAAEGGTVGAMRPDLDPRLRQRLGVDPNRPLTQAEVGHLLSGLRADGQAIEGKQVQAPMRSVAAVFGLDEKTLPSADAVERVLAGRRPDGEAPMDAKGAALADTIVQGARKRFLAAYGMSSGQEPTGDQIAHMKAGRTVTGLTANASDVLWKLNATKQPVAFVDMVWKADKSVSVAWALANTEAERSIIRQAHDDAVAFAMTYVEDQLGYVRRGKEGAGGSERGALTYMIFRHYTARPTAEIARTDEQGQAYTEFAEVPLRRADPLIHTHAPLLNAVMTADGHIGSLDLDRLDGLVKELGGVYQAKLAQNLRAHGIDTVLDKETGSARVAAIPDRVRWHYSKRSQDGQEAARAYAREQGLDWDTLSPERKSAMLNRGIEETRHAKAKRDGDSDFVAWRQQAVDELVYQHRSVLRPNDIKPELTPDQRRQKAYEVSLDLIERALSRNAKLGAQAFREFAVRGLVEAGIGDDPAADIKAVMRLYREHGVRQDGQMVPIIFGKDVALRGKERWSVTTELHAAQEQRVIDLARSLSADTSQSLSPASVERAQREFLAAHPKIDPNDPHWQKQGEVSHHLATGGRLGVAVGVAGAGKSTLISPVVAAAKAEERQVFGIGRGWKQATSLREAGIDPGNVAAVAAFLKRANEGRLKLGDR